MGNTSLDDFTGEDDDEASETPADHSASADATDGSDATAGTENVEHTESAPAAEADPDETSAADAADDTGDADPDPAVSTYDWSPAGAECAECGESVEQRWRDDGALVCSDCKSW